MNKPALLPTPAQTMRHLDALSAYACTCALCRRSCCQGDWDVVVSRDELAAGLAGSPACQELARRAVEPNPRAVGDADAFRCRMGDDGRCAALTGDGLCAWQVERGTCAGRACDEFPRSAVRWRGVEYRFASLACEAVVEPLLGRVEPLRLVERAAGEPGACDGAVAGTLTPAVFLDGHACEARPLLGLYPELVRFGMGLLQDRSAPLGVRVAALVDATGRIEALEEEGRVSQVPALLASAARRGAAGIAGRAPDGSCDNALLTMVARLYTSKAALRAPRVDHTLRVLRGLGFELEVPRPFADALAAEGVDDAVYRAVLGGMRLADPGRLAVVRAVWCDPGERFEAFFEHLAVTEYLRSMTPVVQPGVRMSAVLFACWYVAMTLSVKACCADGHPSDDALVDAVVRTQRLLAHGCVCEGFAEWLVGTGLDNSDVVAAMARAV